MTMEEFNEGFGMLLDYYPNTRVTDGLVNIYYMGLAELSVSEFNRAIGKIVKEHDGDFLPKVSTILKYANSDIDLKFIANAQFDGREQNDVFRISHIIADDGYTKDIEFPVDDVYVALHDTKPVLNFFIPEMCKERDYMPSHRNVVMELPSVNNEFVSAANPITI